jgi:hypothetical protein
MSLDRFQYQIRCLCLQVITEIWTIPKWSPHLNFLFWVLQRFLQHSMMAATWALQSSCAFFHAVLTWSPVLIAFVFWGGFFLTGFREAYGGCWGTQKTWAAEP